MFEIPPDINDTIYVTWNPPVDFGGRTDIGYTITHRDSRAKNFSYLADIGNETKAEITG